MSISDKEYYQLTVSISKALHGFEMPLKVKHARAAIIGTFRTHGAHSFWAIVLRQPLQENRITAWKFCHLLHKVLREGHGLCCQQSMRHRAMLAELGKLWGHLNDGYGLCIRHYTKLLVTKLEFHDRNPRIPGSLALKRGELESIADNDVNNYFQLAVEMFDYLDDIISLQATIFNSITTFHVNSMTLAGQCRLSPLIPLIQDSNQLYDFLVRIMFKLHGNLPNDVLQGHRDRFRAIFTQLKSFYNQSKNLQYFVNLITVPKLPESAPNFGSQVDFGAYRAPVVVIPEPDPEQLESSASSSVVGESVTDNLVDMSMPSSASSTPTHQPHHQQHHQHHQHNHQNHQNHNHHHHHHQNHHQNNSAEMMNNQRQLQYQESEAAAAATVAAQAAAAEDFKRVINERDDLIRHLHTEVDRLGKSLKMISTQQRDEQSQLEQQVATLNSKLSDAHEELMNTRFVKEELELKAQTAERQLVEEEKLKANEEKFHKLKVMYTQIRDDHVKLLRQHGEVSKQLATTTQFVNTATKEKDELRCQLDEIQMEQKKAEEKLQQSATDVSREKNELTERVQELQHENSALSAKLDDLLAHKEDEILELNNNITKLNEEIMEIEKKQTEKCEENQELLLKSTEANAKQLELEQKLHETQINLQELQIKSNEKQLEHVVLVQNVEKTNETRMELENSIESLKIIEIELTERCDKLTADHEQTKEEYNNIKEELTKACEEKSAQEEKLNNATQQIKEISTTLEEKTIEILALKESYDSVCEEKSIEVTELKARIEEMDIKYQQLHETGERTQSEKDNFESDLQDLLHEQEQLNEKHQFALEKIATLELELQEAKIRDETRIRALIESCIKSSEKLTTRAIGDDEVAGEVGKSSYFMMISEELQTVLNELAIVHTGYMQNNQNVEGLARKVILAGHLMATVHVQGMTICNTSADIEYGERITEEIKNWSQDVMNLFRSLYTTAESSNVEQCLATVKSKLFDITSMVHAMSKKSDSTEIIGDIIEAELAGMDTAIEEAANRIEEMLSKSRASDSGITLEVNEKILDACTALMNNIRFLVQKSRVLQAEIVSLGKGSASAKEFYKRNHQWTEGLISAAKSVAQGANFLVTAANKAVSGDSKHQLDLIVAAQEIAACTAQLVVSSRVKAPRGSVNLAALGQASREVTQATGGVVATVKDCSQRLEDSKDLDLSNLTVHQAKTLEMEIQVKVLELEQALQVERHRLASFRRKNYRES